MAPGFGSYREHEHHPLLQETFPLALLRVPRSPALASTPAHVTLEEEVFLCLPPSPRPGAIWGQERHLVLLVSAERKGQQSEHMRELPSAAGSCSRARVVTATPWWGLLSLPRSVPLRRCRCSCCCSPRRAPAWACWWQLRRTPALPDRTPPACCPPTGARRETGFGTRCTLMKRKTPRCPIMWAR